VNHSLALKINQALDKIEGVKRVYYIERELNDLEDRLWEYAAKIAEQQCYLNGTNERRKISNESYRHVAEKLREKVKK